MSKVLLKKLQVHELHSQPYAELRLDELADDVTVVYGQNAAGKSVLALAASRVLCTSELDKKDRIIGRIQHGESVHEVNLHGKPEDVPWPQSSREDLYCLSVADVVVAPSDSDQQKIRDALAGGINLEALTVPAPKGKPKKDMDAAWTALSERQGKARELADDEARIPALEKQVAEASRAKEDADLLGNWLTASRRKRDGDSVDADISKIRAQHPGIENQSETASEHVKDLGSTYQSACKTYQDAQSGLNQFGGNPATLELQSVDQDALQECKTTYDKVSEQLEGGKQQQKICKTKAEDALQKRLQLHDKPAFIPLSSQDEQKLRHLVDCVLQAEKNAEMIHGRLQESQNNLRQAQQAFRNVGGDPSNVPEHTIHTDHLQAAIHLDTQIAMQEVEVRRAQQALEEAKNVLELARTRLPNIKRPSRDVINQILQEQQIASLMDAYRAAAGRRDAFNSVARQFEQKATEAETAGDGLNDAETALKDWLRFAPETANASQLLPLVTAVVGAALLAGAIGLAVGWLWATLVAVCGMVVIIILASRGQGQPTNTRLQRQAAANRVPQQWQPRPWTLDGAVSALALVVKKRQEIDVLRERQAESRIMAETVDVNDPLQQLKQCISLIKELTGIPLPDDPANYGLANLVHNLHNLAAAEDSKVQAERHLEEVDKKQKELEQQRDELIHVTSGAPATIATGAAVKDWADKLDAFRREKTGFGEKEQDKSHCNTKTENAKGDLRSFFDHFDWPCMDDVAVAQNQFLSWFAATESAKKAEDELQKADQDVKDASDKLQDLKRRLSDLFERYCFKFTRNGSLQSQSDSFRDWFSVTNRFLSAKESMQDAEARFKIALDQNGIPTHHGGQELSLEARLDECVRRAREIVPKLRERSDEEKKCQEEIRRLLDGTKWHELFERLKLEREPTEDAVSGRLMELKQAANQEEDLRNQITRTLTLVDQAEKANDLRGAQGAMNHAVAAMDSWLRGRQDQRAWEHVVEVIGDGVRRESTPVIVQKTNEHLQNLTGGRYGNITIAGKDVCVRDTLEDRVKTIGQLSTGTRVHLALALRLAVIEASEISGNAFPLLLDEVMATSDPDASAAIARAIKKIAETRQVILFTNQPDDLNVLRHELGDHLSVKTLGPKIPIVQKPIAAPDIPKQEIPNGQIPLTTSISQWPPELLTGLIMGLGTTCRTVHEALAGTDQNQRRHNDAILAAVEAVREKVAKAYLPLQESALEKVEWITGAFRERVLKLRTDVGGDPKRFLEGFKEIKGMREKSSEACEKWLEEHGYLTDLPVPGDLTQIADPYLPHDMQNRDQIIKNLCGLFTLSNTRRA